MLHYKSTSPEDTAKIAGIIGRHLESGDILTLTGDLGAGKTHFTKGLAAALGVERIVNSPTFTIIKEYNGRLPLYHMDVYRLDEEEADELGIEEYLESEGICVIEWPEKIKDILPEDRLEITITRENETNRDLHLKSIGDRFHALCKELQRHENISD
ncbi:tRNA (adenosine(37)-N6)-threonylcarbamoyltransferase complex ATPase subunit type 1 TsaE [Salibacterium salarium]|uniref:tRNA threonylcarbamoyladenosine biosynthesis protein TsaE n=1 Tax=Salibacterium salarium TaxID=284579 RepID=A0A428MT49_9BACI|nr:tRNA (adenosine(37)-N6)-threonylcarbamoyltransferase complex ATPase subunit type 1 TsaE [Salibacterium salarium]RSL29288.1 tRNA (adenosine(37)-N6)-threonylcarbamoyltransferase complex ATPase subunit type 1 TsaE [Salibacterium salarium]